MSDLVHAKSQDEIMKYNSYAIFNYSNYSVDLKICHKKYSSTQQPANVPWVYAMQIHKFLVNFSI